MPEGRESVDSFDDFFGVAKDDGARKKSPIQPKENGSSLTALVKTQPVTKRPETPLTPEERIPSTPKKKPNTPARKASSVISDRTESIQQEAYEPDFDDDEEDNMFEDNESVHETPIERSKPTSLPPPKRRSSDIIRHESDPDMKKSYTISRQTKPKYETHSRRKDNSVPRAQPQPIRQMNYPIRRRKDVISNSAKSEHEQRALSAKHDKLRGLEARIAELRRELDEQRIENSTLRTIQRREEKAIKKYEEKEYDIHRIVRDYTNQIEHIRSTLATERENKQRLEKQMEHREEKLREQKDKLKKYETIVQEKNLDERFELKEKLNQADKKLQTYQEKLVHHEKFIETLEKNHRYEINQELVKQRDLKRQLEARSQKYNDLLTKFEDKTRQIDTMHIYAQRTSKISSDSPSNLSKARSLQSLQDNSPRSKEKIRPKKPATKKETDDKPSTKTNGKLNLSSGHLPPKTKPPARRLSTPKNIDEVDDDETIFGKTRKKSPSPPPPPPPPPPAPAQKPEQRTSQAQIHKRSVAPSSSIFKLTEPAAPSKPRPKQELDEKWSTMFGDNKQDDSAKDDLLAKLVADEQQERRQATNVQRSTMSTFESSTRAPTTTIKPTTTVKPSVDPFESLFNNNPSKPTAASRTNDLDDFFSSKPSTQTTSQNNNKNDPFESLFGPARTTDGSNVQNERLQRPKVVQNPTRVIPNRTTFDEVEDFVL